MDVSHIVRHALFLCWLGHLDMLGHLGGEGHFHLIV